MTSPFNFEESLKGFGVEFRRQLDGSETRSEGRDEGLDLKIVELQGILESSTGSLTSELATKFEETISALRNSMLVERSRAGTGLIMVSWYLRISFMMTDNKQSDETMAAYRILRDTFGDAVMALFNADTFNDVSKAYADLSLVMDSWLEAHKRLY